MMKRKKFKVINRKGEEVFTDDGIVPDGCALRVPLLLMDSVQQAITESSPVRITDAFVGHRPGYVFATPTKATEARDAAYIEADKRVEDAWRNPAVEAPTDARTTIGDALAARDTWLRDAWRTAR